MDNLDITGLIRDDEPPEVISIDGWVFVLADWDSQPNNPGNNPEGD